MGRDGIACRIRGGLALPAAEGCAWDHWETVGRLGNDGTGGNSWAAWEFMAISRALSACRCESLGVEPWKRAGFAAKVGLIAEHDANILESAMPGSGIAGNYGKKYLSAIWIYI
ncbi:hypothetical protein KUV61_14690 [Nocardioides marinus]|nr:hypothetical protein [Nocardioides marinus]